MNTEQVNLNGVAPEPSGVPERVRADHLLAMELSALADGELNEEELDAVLGAYARSSDIRADWHCYHLIGDVLRGSTQVSATVSPLVFVEGIEKGLQLADTDVLARPVAELVPMVRGAAANDSVMRWKLVAGVASVAAVVAVSWGALQNTGVGGIGSGPEVASLRLAETPPSTISTAVAKAGTSDPSASIVEVDTGQGTLIRDARLEQMLAEHRQYGGMSALQMPAGFLRNATYDASPQR